MHSFARNDSEIVVLPDQSQSIVVEDGNISQNNSGLKKLQSRRVGFARFNTTLGGDGNNTSSIII
jgi:hypothetical protein